MVKASRVHEPTNNNNSIVRAWQCPVAALRGKLVQTANPGPRDARGKALGVSPRAMLLEVCTHGPSGRGSSGSAGSRRPASPSDQPAASSPAEPPGGRPIGELRGRRPLEATGALIGSSTRIVDNEAERPTRLRVSV
ncbi:hypothetical protein KM043_009290 [Ampulex compressa]|nr:hypothetical protein KM043_009290 [Ampulex compressa]